MKALAGLVLGLAAAGCAATEASVRYRHFFDRNALRDALPSGDSIVAITESGSLLRFDRRTLQLAGERTEAAAAIRLGRGPGEEIIAAFEDGRLCSVDPGTLALVEAGRDEGEILWLGRLAPPHGLLTVTRAGDSDRAPDFVIHDFASGTRTRTKLQTFPGRPVCSFLLDSQLRLWIGFDQGEWGGGAASYDVRTRAVTTPDARFEGVTGMFEGVYGFVEPEPGRVWTHGGLSHLGTEQGYILDLPSGTLTRFAKDEGRPRSPITHIVSDGARELLVFSHEGLWKVDRDLKAWRFLHPLGARAHAGRPDAMGSYPGLGRLWIESEEPLSIVAATRRDGLMRIAGKAEQTFAQPGQLEVRYVDAILTPREGTLLATSRDTMAWSLRDGAWRRVELAPRRAPAEDRPWSEVHSMVGRDGSLTLVSGDGWTPGRRTLVRRATGREETLADDGKASIVPAAVFQTPDGAFWQGWHGPLQRLVEGRWKDVGEEARIGWRIKVCGKDGPPWLLFEPGDGVLHTMTYGPDFESPRLERIRPTGVDGKPLRVHDARDEEGGKVLFATDAGLKSLDLRSGRLQEGPSGAPAIPLTQVCRDSRGRLWLGGRGLWILEAGRTRPLQASIPLLAHSQVEALEADPDEPGGVIASLGTRGVLYIRAD